MTTIHDKMAEQIDKCREVAGLSAGILTITGVVCEVGEIVGDADDGIGFLLAVEDGRFISIAGLTQEESKQANKGFLTRCVLTLIVEDQA